MQPAQKSRKKKGAKKKNKVNTGFGVIPDGFWISRRYVHE